ncbi:unnamed protein product [Haemonchus placei]|uniref:Uncharacterized protein n=1 Tax=Haemonchus placei TaxID=6290 RepID=A0A3P8BNF3_HAEPC|nr:unnamed protein product [Haemonchus placei]
MILRRLSCFLLSSAIELLKRPWILQSSKAVKKYDRNCFFSPVQCMLSFNQGQEQPIVFTSKGKRLYYYRK